MEKKVVFSLLLLMILIFFGVYHALHQDYGGEFINYQQARNRWGSKHFDPYKFRDADTKDRAAMITELILRKLYIGGDIAKVKEDLGKPDGFFVEGGAAYMLQERSGDIDESWQLAFVPDEHGIVQDVVIHKRCCYTDPWMKLFKDEKKTDE